MDLSGLKAATAPSLAILAVTPLLVIGSLLFVALMTPPAMVSFLAQRPFCGVGAQKTSGVWVSAVWSRGATGAAIEMLLISIPLWFSRPLIMQTHHATEKPVGGWFHSDFDSVLRVFSNG